PIGFRPVGHVVDRHLQTLRCRVGILIVVAEEYDGKFAHRGKVHRFVEVAATGPSVAGAGEGHTALLSDLKRQSDSSRDGQIVGQVADKTDHAAIEIAHVHVAVLAFAGASALAEVLGKNFAWREAADEESSHVSVKGSDDVITIQRRGIADRNRFHSVAGVHTADDPTLTIEGTDAFLKGSGKPKVVVHL